MNTSDFEVEYQSIKLPNKKDFTEYYFYSKGKFLGKSKDGNAYSNCVVEKIYDDQAYKEARKDFDKRMSEVEQEFINWLYDDLGIQDNPKKEKLYSIAYERGHSGGFSEIYSEALDLVELIQ